MNVSWIDPARLQPTTVADGAAELRASIRSLLPGLRDRAGEAKRLRQVPQENVEALRSAGLFKVVQPRRFGGFEHDFSVLTDLVIDIAGACPSTGWACGLLAAHQWLVASFSAEAQRDVRETTPDAVACASYAPACKATEVGGYALSGRWAFASGCDSADWGVCAAIVPGEGEEEPGPAFLLVPRADFVIEDAWHGTGSKTVVIAQAVVPAHRVLRFRETTTGRTPGRLVNTNPALRHPDAVQHPVLPRGDGGWRGKAR